MFFVGSYQLNIDAKNRLSVPYAVRDRMMDDQGGRAFYVLPGRKRGTLMLYPDAYFRKQREARVPGDLVSEATFSFAQFEFSQTHLLEPDAQGRVLIPERLLKRAGLDKEVTLVGVHDHLELWDRAAFEAFEEATWQAYPEGRLAAMQELDAQARATQAAATEQTNEPA